MTFIFDRRKLISKIITVLFGVLILQFVSTRLCTSLICFSQVTYVFKQSKCNKCNLLT